MKIVLPDGQEIVSVSDLADFLNLLSAHTSKVAACDECLCGVELADVLQGAGVELLDTHRGVISVPAQENLPERHRCVGGLLDGTLITRRWGSTPVQRFEAGLYLDPERSETCCYVLNADHYRLEVQR